MPVVIPKRRPAFKPFGKLRGGAFAGGKKGVMASLNLTPMVDMFTVLVIFLLQNFSASGEIMFIQKGMVLPDAKQTHLLGERGPVVTILPDQILLEGQLIATVADMDEAEPGIPELAEKLTGIRERDEKLFGASDPTEGFKGHILVQCDKATDFMLVRKVIFAVNEAGWVHLQFAVTALAPEGGEGGEGGEGAAEE